MSDTPWTPGPWTVEEEFVSDEYILVARAGTPEEDEGYQPRLEGDANARLIAAAPEMAELLEGWLYPVKMLLPDGNAYSVIAESDREAAAALLARIRGES